MSISERNPRFVLKSCAWCGAELGAAARRQRGRTGCPACGAATTDPWPGPSELGRAYERYRPASGRFSGLGDALLRRSRARPAGRIDRLAPVGAVLDVGAGDGTLVDALRARGRRAEGLERAPARPDLREAEVESLEGPWSAVVFWHSLEHLPAPASALEAAAGRLCPRGLLLVAVPNSESLQARAFGDDWFHLDLPRHLVHLSTRTLVERLGELELEVTRVSHWRGGQILFGWMHGLVGRLPGRPNLYDAIRRPEARSAPMPIHRRVVALAAAVVLWPAAAVAAAVEVVVRRGGTVYVEARRA